MKYLYNYIKFFEDRNTDGKNVVYAQPDVEQEDIHPADEKLKDLFRVIGLPVTIGLITNQIEPKNDDILIMNRHYRFKFDTNVNSQPYSIVNILTRPDLVPFAGGSINEPFKFREKSYISEKWGNNNITFFKELTVSISKFNPLKESLNFKGHHCWFNASSSEEIYENVITCVNKEFENLCDSIYMTAFGTKEIPNLSFTIKELINTNSTYNTPIIIPDSVVTPIIEAINRLPNSYKVWNEIQKENPILYNKIKNTNTDTASDMGEMGF